LRKVLAAALFPLLSSAHTDARAAEPTMATGEKQPAVADKDGFMMFRYGGGGSHVVYGHKSAGSVFGDSVKAAGAGLVLFLLSFPCLWFNEQRQAKMEELFIRASKIARTDVSPEKVDSDYERMLVHMQGESKTFNQLSDQQYAILVENCAKLTRTTEMLQWVEKKTEEEEDDNFGGKRTKTTYSYNTEWRTEFIDSSSFHDNYGHINPSPSQPLGTQGWTANPVNFGAFTLPPNMVERLCNTQDCTGEAFQGAAGNQGATLPGGWCRRGRFLETGAGNSVGDIRVHFTKVPCGDTTILAVQAGNSFEPMDYKSQVTDSGKVMPLGGLQQPLNPGGQNIGINIEEGGASFTGGCCGCCTACGLVGALVESNEHIYEIHESHMTAGEVMDSAMKGQNCIHLGLRIGGWLCMCLGLSMMFGPFPTLFRFIPFAGTYIQTAVGWVTSILAFLLGSFLTSVTIGIAWLVAHPMKSIKFFVMGAGFVAVMYMLVYMYSQGSSQPPNTI